MKCKKCGFDNKEGALYCSQCGSKIESSKIENIKKNRIFMIAGIVVVVIAIALAIYFIFINQEPKKSNYDLALEDADTYIEDMDYQKAEDAYLQAIDIDPKQVEPYQKLSNLYMSQNDYPKVVEILKKADENTDDETIKIKYSLATYVQDVLIPQIGQVSEGNYKASYVHITNPYNAFEIDSIHDLAGILTSRIMDFDNDGQDELLVLTLDNLVPDFDYTRNQITINIYEESDGNVSLSDSLTLEQFVLGIGDLENTGIFIQEHDDQIYICGTLYNLFYNYSDGYSHETFILQYKENKLAKQLYKYESASIPTAQDNETADAFKNIGLTSDAAIVKETNYEYFNFTDQVSDVLLKITGKTNLDSNRQDQTINDLEYKIELILSNKKSVNTDIYLPILEAYYNSWQDKFEIPNETEYRVQLSGLQARYNENMKLYYCYQDINHDGISEMFIGVDDMGAGEIEICDLWTYNGLNLKAAPESFLFGDRESMTYCSDNLVRVRTYYGGEETITFNKLNFLGQLVTYKTSGDDETVDLDWQELTDDLFKNKNSNNKNTAKKKNTKDKATLKAEMDALEQELAALDEQAVTTVEMQKAANNALEQWTNKMNEVISVLKDQMNSKEIEAFNNEQEQWSQSAENQATEAREQFGPGTMGPVEYLTVKRQLTRDRAYALLDRID
ncbi:hypothetical protein B5F09_11430 [Erysipelatoclostridium sp. An173]|uniref:lysozyme inhibitor LprI family protein n=1 Tax=Erysipelatoclostridium sp. An173 TaxID=1965571 RepID=UPI000B38B1A0|nr:lysozyme inhibitor LprI family protein [Erysipelatoclostridium sp. An173]OUP73493.1 hypothetical protein B5F09_11430 [Erysipelatoclostridium sp. An173]